MGSIFIGDLATVVGVNPPIYCQNQVLRDLQECKNGPAGKQALSGLKFQDAKLQDATLVVENPHLRLNCIGSRKTPPIISLTILNSWNLSPAGGGNNSPNLYSTPGKHFDYTGEGSIFIGVDLATVVGVDPPIYCQNQDFQDFRMVEIDPPVKKPALSGVIARTV